MILRTTPRVTAALLVILATSLARRSPIENSAAVPGGVEVTPDAGTVSKYAGGVYNAGFWVKNTRTVPTTYSITCSGSGKVTCLGTDVEFVSLDPQQTTDVSATYSTGSAGAGTITLTASGAATDQGYYDVTVTTPPTPAAPEVTLMNQNSGNIDRGLCLTVGAGEAAGISCGDLFVTQSLPAYRTLGKDRSLGLLYNSATSNGLVLVAANVTPPAGTLTPNSVKVILTVGSAKDSAVYFGMSPGSTQQIVIGRNITGLATGVYDAMLQVQSVFTGTVLDKTLQTQVIVVNRSASEFGKGWGLMGLERVITDPVVSSRRLWVTGDGSARVYNKGVTLTSGMLSQSGMTGYSAANVVDGNTTTQGWHTDAAVAGAWLQADLGSAQEVTTLGMYTDNAYIASVYDIQYSDNGSNWSTAFSQFRPVTNSWQQITWRSVGLHRYWRILLTNTPGPGSWINELSFGNSNTYYGAPGDGPDSLIWTGSGYLRNLRHGSVVGFDAAGKHVTTTNRLGAITTFNWTTLGGQPRLSSIVIPPNDAITRSYAFYWNGSTNLLDSLRDPGNRPLKATMSSGLLTRLTNPMSEATRFSYTGNLLTKRVYVRKGMKGDSASTTYAYANSVRVTSYAIQTDSAGATFATTTITPWDELGLAAVNFGSGSWGANSSADGLNTRVDGPLAGTSDAADFWVNAFGQPRVSVGVGLSTKTSIWYHDPRFPALATRVQYPHPTSAWTGGRMVSMSYDNRSNLVQTVDSTYWLDSRPNQVSAFVYGDVNTPDSPTRVDDALGRRTFYSYTTLGLTDSIIDPAGHRTKFEYISSGSRTGMVNGVIERNVETWEEGVGNDSTDTLRDHIRRFTYDTNGVLRTDSMPTGVRYTYVPDNYGRIVDVYSPVGTRTFYTFDAMNRVLSTGQYGAAQTIPYSINGLLGCDSTQLSCVDSTRAVSGYPSQFTTMYYHGTAGIDSVKDPRSVTRKYKYDARGALKEEINDYGFTKKAFFSTAGLLDSTKSEVAAVVKKTYDAYGRLTKSISPKRYSSGGPPADTTEYTYDLIGNVLTVKNREGTITRGYNFDGSVKFKKQYTDSLAYTYDLTGARTRMIRNGQDTVLYHYNTVAVTGGTGRLDSMVVYWKTGGAPLVRKVRFAYDGLGRRRRIFYPDSTEVKYRYDKAGTLRRVVSKRPGSNPPTGPDLLDFTFRNKVVDPEGRILRQEIDCGGADPNTACAGTNPASSSLTIKNAYDRRGMLIRQVKNSQSDSMAYDNSGNRTYWREATTSSTSITHKYTIDASHNRLLRDTASSWSTKPLLYSYDADGATSKQESSDVSQRGRYRGNIYDGLGRINGYNYYINGTNGYEFVDNTDYCRYDADGQLTVACHNASPRLTFDGSAPITTGGAGSSHWFFISGGGTDDPLIALYRTTSGTTVNREFYYVTDGAGRQFVMSSTDGYLDTDDLQQLGRKDGAFAGGTNKSHTYGASRMEAPSAPGVSYFRNRAYDQATGRWLQEDPIGIAGGVNLYQFNGNNPVSYTDPFGLCEKSERGNATQSSVCSSDITGWSRERVLEESDKMAGRTMLVVGALEFGIGQLRAGINDLGNLLRGGAEAGGRHGGVAHRAAVSGLAKCLESCGYEITAGGGMLPERAVQVGGGRIRFPDIIAQAPDGTRVYVNVGRTTAAGAPVPREVRALSDLQGTGTQSVFVPYDR